MKYLRHLSVVLLAISLAGCAGGNVSTTTASNSDSNPSSANEQASDRPPSEVPAGRMRWVPIPHARVDTPLDLCDDAQAIEAGLDGGDLNSDRVALGLDCAGATGPRFGVVSPEGDIALGRDAAEARSNAASSGRETPDDLKPSSGIAGLELELGGVPLGYFGAAHGGNEEVARGNDAALMVLSQSLAVRDDTLRGLVVNRSANHFYHSVSVGVDGRSSASFPFVLQPFEVASFEIRDWGDEGVPGVSDFETFGQKTGPDRSRSILITGTPGRFVGTSDEVRALSIAGVDIPEGDEVRYFQSALESIASTSHPAFTPAGLKATDLTAVVAFIDNDGRVIGQQDVNIELFETGSLRDDRMLFGAIGFVVPSETTDFSIWVGGKQ